MTPCTAWRGVHRFKARYDNTGVDPQILTKVRIERLSTVNAVLDACRTKTYVHDICIKCGAIVQRPPK